MRERRSTRAIKEWRQDEVEKEQLIHSIEQVLKDMFDSHMEVPFIAMYRKQVGQCPHTPLTLGCGKDLARWWEAVCTNPTEFNNLHGHARGETLPGMPVICTIQ